MRIRFLPAFGAAPLLLGLFALGEPNPLYASDGVIEINQVRALAGGVTPGDDPGFPVTISAPGSYVLTGNLDVRVEANPLDVNAIWFVSGSEGSTLDLNGFSLIGPYAGCAPSCAFPAGSGSGIRITPNFVSVKNGTVRGFAKQGVWAQSGGGTLSDLLAIENGGVGVSTAGHRIRSCESTYNRYEGFYVSNASVESSRAIANGGSGFYLESSSATRSVSIGNGIYGVGLYSATFRDGVSAGNTAGSLSCDNAAFIAANHLEGAITGSCVQLEANFCGNTLCP